MPKNKKNPDDPIDRHVGSRLRERRGILNYSLEALAGAVGLNPAQLQSYESGAEHLPEPILYELCHILYTTPNYFFAGDYDLLRPAELEGEAKAKAPLEESLFAHHETLELIKVWYEIGDQGVRSTCLEFLRTMAVGRRMLNGSK